jgi:hypothetical protein
MKYEKPQVVCLADCVVAIQATEKAAFTMPDSQLQPNLVTISAYEADE